MTTIMTVIPELSSNNAVTRSRRLSTEISEYGHFGNVAREHNYLTDVKKVKFTAEQP